MTKSYPLHPSHPTRRLVADWLSLLFYGLVTLLVAIVGGNLIGIIAGVR
jgi:hypothetical protein